MNKTKDIKTNAINVLNYTISILYNATFYKCTKQLKLIVVVDRYLRFTMMYLCKGMDQVFYEKTFFESHIFSSYFGVVFTVGCQHLPLKQLVVCFRLNCCISRKGVCRYVHYLHCLQRELARLAKTVSLVIVMVKIQTREWLQQYKTEGHSTEPKWVIWWWS